MSPRPGKGDPAEGGGVREAAGTTLRSGGPAASSIPRARPAARSIPGGESQCWAARLPGFVLTGRGSPPSGTPSARRQATRQTGRTPAPSPFLPEDTPARASLGAGNANTNPLRSGTDRATLSPCGARGCSHPTGAGATTRTVLWGHPHPFRTGRRGAGARRTPGSIWVVWLSRTKPLASTPLGSTLGIHPRIPPAGGGTGGWYIPS